MSKPKTRNPFAWNKLFFSEPEDIQSEIKDNIILHNFGRLRTSAWIVLLISVFFVVSDFLTNLYAERYPLSIINACGEVVHITVSVYYICSSFNKKAKVRDIRYLHVTQTIYLTFCMLGFSGYSLSDALAYNTTSAHYFVLILVVALPVLTQVEFNILYVALYALPSFAVRVFNGSLDALAVAIYVSAVLMHLLLKTDYMRSELNRIKFERANAELEEMTYTDYLTKVGNRGALFNLINARCEIWAEANLSACVMMVDIDKFKNYNDTYGHLKGDECLKSIASAMNTALKTETTCESILIRFGGEEFMLFLIGEDSESAMLRTYARIRRNVRALRMKPGNNVNAEYVTVSIGAHSFNYSSDTDIEHEIKSADDQLYNVKANGRDGLCFKSKIYRADIFEMIDPALLSIDK